MFIKQNYNVILLIFIIICAFYILYEFCFGTTVFYNYTDGAYQFFSRGSKNPKCSDRILTITSDGRLGNKIWEYMSLIAFQKLYFPNGTIFLDDEMKNKLQTIFERIDNPNISDVPKPCNREAPIKRIGLIEKPDFFNFSQNNLMVILHPYSCRYADVLNYGLENIKQKLRFHQKWINQGTNVLKHIKSTFGFNETDTVTFIGVHYRGGDYDHALTANYHQKFVRPASYLYYGKAMKHFEQTTENPIFVFVTIDKQWAENNLGYLQNFKIFEHDPIGAAEDLVMLSLCNHSIINYGTYSATSAFFANGTTFAYDLHLPNDGRGYTLVNNMAKVFPNWFLCDNSSPCNTSTRN